MAKERTYGPWVGGLNNVVDETTLKPDELYIAENVFIDRNGCISDFTQIDFLEVDEDKVNYVTGGLKYGAAIIKSASDKSVIEGTSGEPAADDTNEDHFSRVILGGNWVSLWRGRLLVARDDSLIFSDPFNYGVYDPLRNFVAFEDKVMWLAPLDTGIFVGVRGSVKFLQGSSPDNWTLASVSGDSWDGCAAVVKTTHMDEKLVKGAPYVAVWFGPNGFELGLPSGEVVKPQAGKIRVPTMEEGRLIVKDDRLTVVMVV